MQRIKNVSIVFLIPIMIIGCTSINKESISLLKTAAAMCKADASAFKILSGFSIAADSNEKDLIAQYVSDHYSGLCEQAKALSDFSRIAEMGSLEKRSLRELFKMAETARHRAEVFVRMRPKLALVANTVDAKLWITYMQDHESELKLLANTLELFKSKFEEKEN